MVSVSKFHVGMTRLALFGVLGGSRGIDDRLIHEKPRRAIPDACIRYLVVEFTNL